MNRRQRRSTATSNNNYKTKILKFFNIDENNPILLYLMNTIREKNGVFKLPGIFAVNHDAMMKETVLEHKIDCAKGCSHCCNMAVDISEFEFPHLRQGLSKLTTGEKEEVKIKAKIRLDKHKDLNFNERLSAFTPCPLLDKEGTCMIYENRPMVCRTFTSPDSNLCEKMINKDKDEEIKQLYTSQALSTFFDVAKLLAESEKLYMPSGNLRLEWAIYNILSSKEEKEKAEDYVKKPLEKWKPVIEDLKDVKIKDGITGKIKSLF